MNFLVVSVGHFLVSFCVGFGGSLWYLFRPFVFGWSLRGLDLS